MNDLLDGTLDAYRVRRVQVEDLLRRPSATEHATAVHELIRDRTVVITGAGGSIGSELARQVYSLGPRRLVLVDRAESALYLVQRELETRRSRGQGKGELRVHLANVASRPVMDRMIELEAPNIIFHAAAYKHVPMMEEHPSDAVHVNIGGTLALLDAAEAAGVERFVLVSTDKAVRPSSIMGASKRVAEMLVADAGAADRPTVRLGPVRERPGLQRQRGADLPGAAGEGRTAVDHRSGDDPLLHDHPRSLVADHGRGRARREWRPVRARHGRAGPDPGPRPGPGPPGRPRPRHAADGVRRPPSGEKLHEELFYDQENVQPTEVAKILRAMADPPPETVREDVKALLAIATGAQEWDLHRALMDYALGVGVPHSIGGAGRSSDELPMIVELPVLIALRDRDREVTLTH